MGFFLRLAVSASILLSLVQPVFAEGQYLVVGLSLVGDYNSPKDEVSEDIDQNGGCPCRHPEPVKAYRHQFIDIFPAGGPFGIGYRQIRMEKLRRETAPGFTTNEGKSGIRIRASMLVVTWVVFSNPESSWDPRFGLQGGRGNGVYTVSKSRDLTGNYGSTGGPVSMIGAYLDLSGELFGPLGQWFGMRISAGEITTDFGKVESSRGPLEADGSGSFISLDVRLAFP